MSNIQRISPTMLSTLESDEVAWIRTYIYGEREPQNEAMAAGSAFDAFIKWHLHGQSVATQEAISALIEDKVLWGVSEENTDYGRRIGRYLFDEYVKLHGVEFLKEEIGQAQVFMEETVQGIMTYKGHAVPIGGKPDLFWHKEQGGGLVPCIRDWKVSQIKKDKPTIVKGYHRLCLPAAGVSVPRVAEVTDIPNVYHHKEIVRDLPSILPRESTQLCMYAWLCGVPVGEPIDGGIDRLVGMPLRLVTYRGVIGVAFQQQLAERLILAWDRIRELLAAQAEFDNPIMRCLSAVQAQQPWRG